MKISYIINNIIIIFDAQNSIVTLTNTTNKWICTWKTRLIRNTAVFTLEIRKSPNKENHETIEYEVRQRMAD